MTVTRFGRAEGEDILEVVLATGAGAEARIITWGAVLRDLLVPSGSRRQRVVLGYHELDHYIAHSPYFGAIVGRYANRIGGGRFALESRAYELDRNEGGSQLHGGSRGFGQRPWTLVDHDRSRATLALVSEDGDMGYPGRLTATCTYTLLEPATLRIELEAIADRPTPVNLTTHSYYNLDGSPDILDHTLQIAGAFVTPTDEALIPTGEVRSVAGTPYDFRGARPIRQGLHVADGVDYDINVVLWGARGELNHAATLASPRSGVTMELWTTEPGLQFYDGHLLDSPVPGLDGAAYGRNGGLCLEPQRFPDGPNRPHFPPCILVPGTVSRQVSEIRFGSG